MSTLGNIPPDHFILRAIYGCCVPKPVTKNLAAPMADLPSGGHAEQINEYDSGVYVWKTPGKDDIILEKRHETVQYMTLGRLGSSEIPVDGRCVLCTRDPTNENQTEMIRCLQSMTDVMREVQGRTFSRVEFVEETYEVCSYHFIDAETDAPIVVGALMIDVE
jgi:hypothetical protein